MTTKKKELTARETARELSRVLQEFLSQLPPGERREKISAGKKVMAATKAKTSGRSPVSDNHAKVLSTRRTFPAHPATRGR